MHLTIFNFNRFSGKANYSFNIFVPWIARIAEHYNLSPLGLVESIANLVYYQIVPLGKIRFHALALNNKGLKDKIPDRRHYQCGNDYYFGYFPKENQRIPHIFIVLKYIR